MILNLEYSHDEIDLRLDSAGFYRAFDLNNNYVGSVNIEVGGKVTTYLRAILLGLMGYDERQELRRKLERAGQKKWRELSSESGRTE